MTYSDKVVEEDIVLREYTPESLPRRRLTEQQAEYLWREYGDRIDVEEPGFKTNNQWRLKASGYIGHIPLDDGRSVHIQPKVRLSNVFRMLDYAYGLSSIEFLDQAYQADSLAEYYEYLASVLARRTVHRTQMGLYREYLEQEDRLPYLTGRLNMQRHLRKPWDTVVDCSYQIHTADIVHNQLLAWTLFVIGRSALNRPRVARVVRRAYQRIRGSVSLKSFGASDCIGRQYNRLNLEYRQLHAICRFFLDNTGPTHEVGGRAMAPFLINMSSLFELFVAEWLDRRMPPHLNLKAQAPAYIYYADKRIEFKIDLVIEDSETGQTMCVLDTKYKQDTEPASADLQQVIAYAKLRQCSRGVLIYPQRVEGTKHYKADDIALWAMGFPLGGDLEGAGQTFLSDLLAVIEEN